MSAVNDTIAAIATAPGRGGIGIIRVSGPLVTVVAQAIIKNIPKPRVAEFCQFHDIDHSVIDEGIALYFPAPNSFTGEDVLELQGHGGPVILDCLLQRILALGICLARAGEFSERAFLNNKIDLVQAEAIADLIDSSSKQAARAAMRSLQGEFSQRINQLLQQLIELRIYVEACIDFSDEDIEFIQQGQVHERLQAIITQLNNIQLAAQQGAILREGITIVIAGRPNAGKSSLLNQLSGRDSAIVTAIPGTTRDVLREYIHIDGIPLHIIDTAGLRDSTDHIEQEGIRRAWDEIAKADQVLLLVDSKETTETNPAKIWPEFITRFPHYAKIIIVRNKIDLSAETAGMESNHGTTLIRLSAKTGAGIELLKQQLKACVGANNLPDGSFSARRRHLDALQRAQTAITTGMQQLEAHAAIELLAEDLRQAQLALNEITGEFTSDDLLGKIFSSFCIGK